MQTKKLLNAGSHFLYLMTLSCQHPSSTLTSRESKIEEIINFNCENKALLSGCDKNRCSIKFHDLKSNEVERCIKLSIEDIRSELNENVNFQAIDSGDELGEPSRMVKRLTVGFLTFFTGQ
ncbi:MAG: hypothetical protein EOP04_31670 [Proteobacteria bacterium]|nr:MAG: hypothetical protein EOP04_31670 [Pseudomonadota bacterium]